MTKMNIKKAVEHIVDFVKLTVTTVGGTVLILMLLGVVSIPAQAHHGTNHSTTKFIECRTFVPNCQDRGRLEQFFKIVVQEVKQSPAVVIWLQGGEGRVHSLNYGPIEFVAQRVTVVGVDVGWDIPNPKSVGRGRWSRDYVDRVRAAVLWAREQYRLPIFVMGHSAGGQGVSGYLLLDEDNQSLVAGGIWSGANDASPYPNDWGMTVKLLNLPSLIIHHEKDRCESTTYQGAVKRYKKYSQKGLNLGPTEFVTITGGEDRWTRGGDGCGVRADAHGYTGVRKQYTERVMEFIEKYSQR
jgi:hypothetical protein